MIKGIRKKNIDIFVVFIFSPFFLKNLKSEIPNVYRLKILQMKQSELQLRFG